MLNRRLWLTAVFVVLATLSLFVLKTKTAAAEGCVTAQCHSTLLKAKNVHPVAESCDSCHQALQGPHPQKNVKTFKLIQAPPELVRDVPPGVREKAPGPFSCEKRDVHHMS